MIGWLQFLVQITQKKSFATVTGRGENPRYDSQDWCGTALRQTNYQQTFDATYAVRGFLHVGCACYTQQHTVDERQFPGAVWVSLGIDSWKHSQMMIQSPRVHGWSNLPRTQGVTSKVIQWGLKKTHSQTTCKWPTNHLKHILDIVVWIPNFSMPDFSFVGAVWSKPHWEDKNMLEPYFFLMF